MGHANCTKRSEKQVQTLSHMCNYEFLSAFIIQKLRQGSDRYEG